MKKRLLFFFLLAFSLNSLWAQQRVSGTITSADEGEPLIGVSILIEGTTTGTITDYDGKYQLDVPANSTLIFTYTGYSDQVLDVGSLTTLDVVMTEGIALDEVVVTALGMQRDKKAMSYSVTEVEGGSFQEARELNIANSLAGKVAGVNVSSITGGPAGSSRVVIRGNTSLGGNNQPLYVIDGVPLDNSSFGQSGLWGGIDQGDGTSSINPDDIETMTVLKGANAAALYGSRASNGVILITTKSGKSRKGIGIEFTTNLQLEEIITSHFDLQQVYGGGRENRSPTDAAEAWNFGQGNWGARLGGSAVNFDGVSRPYEFQTYNNLDKYYETGSTWTNTLGFSGGDENNQVRINFSDMRSSSFIPNAGFDRQNVSFSYKGNFGDRITLTSKVLYSHEFADNRPYISDSPGNGFQGLMTLPNNYDIDILRGDPDKPGAVTADFIPPDNKAPGEELQISSNLWNQNPWWAAHVFDNDDTRDRLITSQVARIELTDFLYAQGRFSMDWFTRRSTGITPYGTGYNRGGGLNEAERRIREINLEGVLGFSDKYGDISVDAFVGGNRMRQSSETLSLNGNGFNIPFFNTFANLSNQNPGYGISEKGINSVFGSASVGYKDFLYLSATARQDWFSTLNRATNDILYPSIGGSLILSEVMDLSANSPITFAKLRASWAQVGGDTNPYLLDLVYGLGQGHNGQPNANVSGSTVPNPLLKPLTSTEIEVGFDLRMFDNRLGVDFTWYDQTTTDDILNASVAQSSGFTGTILNVGEINNTGIEVLLSGSPIRKSNFNWDLSFNLALNDSEVVSLVEGLDQIRVDGNLGQPRTRWAFIDHVVGQRFGTIVGFTQEMINGQPVFDGTTGQPVRTTSTSILGNGVHRFTGGINNNFNYKGISFDFLIDFKTGGEIYSGTNVRLYASGTHKDTVEPWSDLGVEANGRESVTVTGVDREGDAFTKTITDPNEVSGFYGAYSQLSDRFIRNAAYAKFRQASIGYSIPPSVLGDLPVKSLKLSFVARNLFVIFDNIENVDAESTYNNSNAQGLDYYGLPQTRSYGFNVKATF